MTSVSRPFSTNVTLSPGTTYYYTVEAVSDLQPGRRSHLQRVYKCEKAYESLELEVVERKRAAETMKKRMELDVCLSLMIHSLLGGMKSGDSFAEPLAILGRGNKTSRVGLFQNFQEEDGPRLARQPLVAG